MITGCKKHEDFKNNLKHCIGCKRAYYSWNAQKDRVRLTEIMHTHKLEKGCAHCGYKENVFALEFDHIEPRKDTSKKWQTPKYKKALLELLDDPNIQVLCANCHKIKTRMNNDHKSRSEASQLNKPATTKEGNN